MNDAAEPPAHRTEGVTVPDTPTPMTGSGAAHVGGACPWDPTARCDTRCMTGWCRAARVDDP